MAQLVIAGDSSGSCTLQAQAVAGSTTLTLPTSSGALLVSGGALGTPSSGTLTNCTFPTLNQNTTGSAASATTATNLAGGSAGTVPYQTGSGATAMLAAGSSGQVLTSSGASAPTWTTISTSPPTTYGAVGTYTIASFPSSSNILYTGGTTIAGSSLYTTGSSNYGTILNAPVGYISGNASWSGFNNQLVGLGLSGTWRQMTDARDFYGTSSLTALFVRIS